MDFGIEKNVFSLKKEGNYMTYTTNKLYSEIETLPQEFVQEVFDFVMFLKYKQSGFAVSIKNEFPSDELMSAINDVENRRNLIGPFDTAEAAVKSMLED